MTAGTLTQVDELLEATYAPWVASKLSDRDVMFIARLRLRRRELGEGMLNTMTVKELGRLTSLVEEV